MVRKGDMVILPRLSVSIEYTNSSCAYFHAYGETHCFCTLMSSAVITSYRNYISLQKNDNATSHER